MRNTVSTGINNVGGPIRVTHLNPRSTRPHIEAVPARRDLSAGASSFGFSVIGQGLENLGSRRPYGVLTTGKSLFVPSCGGKYHAPSIPIDPHWDSSRVPA